MKSGTPPRNELTPRQYLETFVTNVGSTFRLLRGELDARELRDRVKERFRYKFRDHLHLLNFEDGVGGLGVWDLACYLYELGVLPGDFFHCCWTGAPLPKPRHSRNLNFDPLNYFDGFKRSGGPVIRRIRLRRRMTAMALHQRVLKTFGQLIQIPSYQIWNNFETGRGNCDILILGCCLYCLATEPEDYFTEVEAYRLTLKYRRGA